MIILEAQGPGSLLVSAMFGDNLIFRQLLGVPLASTRLINIGSGTKIGKLLRELTYWKGFRLKEATHSHAKQCISDDLCNDQPYLVARLTAGA